MRSMTDAETDKYYNQFTMKRRYTKTGDILKRVQVLDHGKSVKKDLQKVTAEIQNLSEQYQDVKELLADAISRNEITKAEEKMKIYDRELENQRGKQMGKASKQQYEEYITMLKAKKLAAKKQRDQWKLGSVATIKLDKKGRPIHVRRTQMHQQTKGDLGRGQIQHGQQMYQNYMGAGIAERLE